MHLPKSYSDTIILSFFTFQMKKKKWGYLNEIEQVSWSMSGSPDSPHTSSYRCCHGGNRWRRKHRHITFSSKCYVGQFSCENNKRTNFFNVLVQSSLTSEWSTTAICLTVLLEFIRKRGSFTLKKGGRQEWWLGKQPPYTDSLTLSGGTKHVCLVGFLTSSSAAKLYGGQVPWLTSDNFTCCRTQDRPGRPWLLSQPVTLYWNLPNQ